MTPLTLTALQAPGAALPGTWKLESGRAVSLRPQEDGVLRIARGRIWATFDGPHAGPANDLGDRVLVAGMQVQVQAGRRLVIESCDRGATSFFSWDPAPALAAVSASASTLDAVVLPWRELQLAAALGGRAAVRLTVGVAGLVAGALSPRPATVRRVCH